MKANRMRISKTTTRGYQLFMAYEQYEYYMYLLLLLLLLLLCI